MARPPKFDRPISVEEARKNRQYLTELKKTVHYIGDPEHKKSRNHDFGCTPPSQYKEARHAVMM
jgi:hypothetical protein